MWSIPEKAFKYKIDTDYRSLDEYKTVDINTTNGKTKLILYNNENLININIMKP